MSTEAISAAGAFAVEAGAVQPSLSTLGRPVAQPASTDLAPAEPWIADLLRLLERCRINTETGCWEWRGPRDAAGYGRTSNENAHRATYKAARGPIPEGLELDHLCRVRHCVSPWHLEAVTHRENVLRGEGVAAKAARRTHCPQGHPYDETNTYVHKGTRHCRTCQAAQLKRPFDPARHSHGLTGYGRGCRCGVCVAANSERWRLWYQRSKAASA